MRKTLLPFHLAETYQQEWDDVVADNKRHSSLVHVNLVRGRIAEQDNGRPFYTYSTLFSSIKGSLEDHIPKMHSNEATQLSKAKTKARAVKRAINFDDSNSDVSSSEAQQLLEDQQEQASKRGRTKGGQRQTVEEDKKLARLYLQFKDRNLVFQTISASFDDCTRQDCKDRFKSIRRTKALGNMSHEDVSKLILSKKYK